MNPNTVESFSILGGQCSWVLGSQNFLGSLGHNFVGSVFMIILINIKKNYYVKVLGEENS